MRAPPPRATAPGAATPGLADAAAVATPAVLLVILGAFLLLLEQRHPYYFLQDDNRTQLLPLLLQYARALRGGELPLYDFHQFLGSPSFSLVSVALFYPPMYGALALSRVLWGHAYATIDLLVAAHFAVGLLGMRRLLRHLGVSSPAVALGALSWPLASIAVYTATSWWLVAGVIAYLPWMVLLSLRLVAAGRARTMATLVLVRALLLAIGHLQFFVYAVGFEVLCTLLVVAGRGDRRWRIRAARLYLASLYVSAALALPMVEPVWHHASLASERATPFDYAYFHDGSYDVLTWLAGAVDPFRGDPAYFARPLEEWRDRVLPYLAFCGHLTLLLALALPLLRWRGWVASPLPLPLRGIAVPLLVALLWTVGALDRGLYLVPVLDRFRWHFKVQVFLVFFLLLLAALALTGCQRVLARRLGARRALAVVLAALALHLASFAWLYGAFPRRSFNYRRMVETPPLREPLAARLRSGRIVSLGFLAADPYGAAQLAYDYASGWGLFQYAGYGNLLSRQHAAHLVGFLDGGKRDGVYKRREVPVRDFEAWGVAWYVLGKNEEDPGETTSYRALLRAHGLQPIAEDARRVIFHDPHAEPLVALHAGPTTLPLTPVVGGSSLRVRFPAAARERQLVAGFLAVPGFSARGRGGERLELGADARGRMVVAVPPGVDGVRLVYREAQLERGVVQAAALLLLPLAVVAAIRARDRARERRGQR